MNYTNNVRLPNTMRSVPEAYSSETDSVDSQEEEYAETSYMNSSDECGDDEVYEEVEVDSESGNEEEEYEIEEDKSDQEYDREETFAETSHYDNDNNNDDGEEELVDYKENPSPNDDDEDITTADKCDQSDYDTIKRNDEDGYDTTSEQEDEEEKEDNDYSANDESENVLEEEFQLEKAYKASGSSSSGAGKRAINRPDDYVGGSSTSIDANYSSPYSSPAIKETTFTFKGSRIARRPDEFVGGNKLGIHLSPPRRVKLRKSWVASNNDEDTDIAEDFEHLKKGTMTANKGSSRANAMPTGKCGEEEDDIVTDQEMILRPVRNLRETVSKEKIVVDVEKDRKRKQMGVKGSKMPKQQENGKQRSIEKEKAKKKRGTSINTKQKEAAETNASRLQVSTLEPDSNRNMKKQAMEAEEAKPKEKPDVTNLVSRKPSNTNAQNKDKVAFSTSQMPDESYEGTDNYQTKLLSKEFQKEKSPVSPRKKLIKNKQSSMKKSPPGPGKKLKQQTVEVGTKTRITDGIRKKTAVNLGANINSNKKSMTDLYNSDTYAIHGEVEVERLKNKLDEFKLEKQKMRSRLAQLQREQNTIEFQQMSDIANIQEETTKRMEDIRSQIKRDFKRKKAENEEQKQEYINESMQNRDPVEHLKKQNQQCREEGYKLEKMISNLKESNQKLKEENECHVQLYLEHMNRALTTQLEITENQNRQLSGDSAKYKELINNLEESIAVTNQYGYTEHKVNTFYMDCMKQVVYTLQEKCNDINLVDTIVSVINNETALMIPNDSNREIGNGSGELTMVKNKNVIKDMQGRVSLAFSPDMSSSRRVREINHASNSRMRMTGRSSGNVSGSSFDMEPSSSPRVTKKSSSFIRDYGKPRILEFSPSLEYNDEDETCSATTSSTGSVSLRGGYTTYSF